MVVKKYYKNGHKIAINVRGVELLKNLDKKLWTFEQISFIPHCTIDQLDETCKVVLFNLNENDFTKYFNDFNVIVNLTEEHCDVSYQNKKFIEFVTSDENQKKISRDKFKYYKDSGINVDYEKM